MRWFSRLVVGLGLAVIAIGLLWFLQGSDLVHVNPIACAGKCEPIVGHRPAWQVAGALAVLAGALAASLAVRKLRH